MLAFMQPMRQFVARVLLCSELEPWTELDIKQLKVDGEMLAMVPDEHINRNAQNFSTSLTILNFKVAILIDDTRRTKQRIERFEKNILHPSLKGISFLLVF
ncbi:unnamed protein product [Gongylonema pulchrum]|uniref:Uncharacterized protein n=1 Tax=Gongylonema pulchrum TaxID=637853 RepID=A0A183EDR1_9BILA|nr:unnamed protein product [Gongylonema pulchrum]